jgi:hypothetical protein
MSATVPGLNTLLLDVVLWDILLDASGNIAVATPPYAVAQSVASACRTFLGECYYDTSLGVPYFQQILGKFPPLQLVKQLLADVAATVPGCVNPVVYITALTERKLSGQIQFTDPSGATQVANF